MVYEIRVVNNVSSLVQVRDDGIERWIPEDMANTDYQEYLEWVAEGNEPEVVEA